MTIVTRFAPSPTGPLHLGHAFSAISSFDFAKNRSGTFLLRMEDIDTQRSKPEFDTQLQEDLRWLGLSWPEPILRQSDRSDIYQNALERLDALGVTYRCACSRGDIRAALSAPQEGAQTHGPDGPIYPGTCRHLALSENEGKVTRLNMSLAAELTGTVGFEELGHMHAGHHHYTPEQLTTHCGDIVLARADIGIAYHLAVTLDDADQHISDIIRGEDLFAATATHLVLQRILSLPTPRYHHHRLIRDDTGKRLAKRDDARAIQTYRAAGATPADIRRMIGL